MNPIGSPTNFPQGFANGLSVRGMPLLQMQPGQVFFVGNGAVLNPNQKAGSDGNRGTFLDPLGTLNYALNTATTSGRGDIVFVLPGHYEAIPDATTLTINACGGTAVVGLGAGDRRPTFQFGTATTANVPVRSAGVSLQNLLFLNNFADIASLFTAQGASTTASIAAGPSTTTGILNVTVLGSGTVYVGAALAGTGVLPGTTILSQISGTVGGVGTYLVSNALVVASTTITMLPTDFAIDSCEFRDRSSVLNALTIYTSNTTANSGDGFQFTNNRVSSLGTTAATTAIKMLSATDRAKIYGNFGCSAILNDTAAILAAGANNMTMFDFGANKWERPNTSSTGGSFISNSGTAWTGHAYDNYLYQLDNSAGIWIATLTGGAFGFTNNFSPITGAVDKSALINPAAV